MICKVIKAIEDYSMLSGYNTVIVGVSGGADSMSLLHALNTIKEQYHFNIIAAHVNHGIRGEEALRDENKVKEFCNNICVPLKILHADIPNLSNEWGIGEEECGRKVRYDFFESIDNNAVIATAHTLSDRAETLLFNLTRGTTIKGICSIPPRRDNIIRPLIYCTRSDVENYCKENNIAFVTDSTNSDSTYSRNRIRLNVIPELKKINPSLENSFQRVISSAEVDNDYLDKEAKKLFNKSKLCDGYSSSVILQAHKSLILRVIAKIIEAETGNSPEYIHVNAIMNILNGGKTEISGSNVFVCCNDVLKKEVTDALTAQWETPLEAGNDIVLPFAVIKTFIINISESTRIQFIHKNMLDFNSLNGKLVLRSKQNSDKIKLANSNSTKTLKKLLNEMKVYDKNSVCILYDESGVVWVENAGCCDRCKITHDTKKILKIDVERD